MKNVCIEGWRDVNHSIAMVNQNQILEMVKYPGFRLFHRDAPHFMPHWKSNGLDSGFSAQERQLIDSLPDPGVEQMDVCFRIASPFRAKVAGDKTKTVTFMVTEFGLSDRSFDPPTVKPESFTQDDDLIVTPTTWSRDRLIDFGFSSDKISIVPHGFKADTFRPFSTAERLQARQRLGLREDETVFTNIGVATWNKGIDLLILAFAELRSRGLPVRLILKDHKGLYGIGVDAMFASLSAQFPVLATEAVRSGISVISESLNLEQIRSLYAISDAYVSPYRAEGFNLPVLEALACGTFVITTKGGATDDFVPAALSHGINSRPGGKEDAPMVEGSFAVPDFDDLRDAMHRIALGQRPDEATRARVREELIATHSWATVTQQLMALL